VTWKRWKAALPALGLAYAALVIAACGSSEEPTTTTPPPPVSASTAEHLAKLSDRIATDLDAGATCDAARAADDLMAAVEEADLAATLRPGVEEVASRLVNEVNCPPPPPPPEPEKEEKKKEEKKKDEEEKKGEEKKKEEGNQGPGGDESKGRPGHSGGLPPGQAKLKGEIE
jgi:hypothetical protein